MEGCNAPGTVFDTAGAKSATARQFENGYVAYNLSQGQTEHTYGQKIATDRYPVFAANGNKVYATKGCVLYNNSGNTDEK